MVGGAVLNHVFTSSDSGKTWSIDHLTSPLGVYGDPCLSAGPKGEFYFFHLSNPSGEGWANPDILDRMVCQKRKSISSKWSKGSSIGFNHPKDQDKEWSTVDLNTGNLALTWTQFDTYGSEDEACESNILFSSSKNGKRWSEPIQINTVPGNCIDNSGTTEGATPAFGPDGQVYVTWSIDGKLMFRSLKQVDKKWQMGIEREIQPTQVNWAFDIPGVGRANGMPITKCDVSNSANRGTIYVNWADQRNGEDDTDIWLVKSTDEGKNWSEPVRVNDDPPGKQQFFTWMDVDPHTGFIYIVFYDRRNHEGIETDVYLAVSKDGGATFTNTQISESPFVPSDEVFFGDYNNISAVNGVVRPIWTRSENEKLSIWTALINDLK